MRTTGFGIAALAFAAACFSGSATPPPSTDAGTHDSGAVKKDSGHPPHHDAGPETKDTGTHDVASPTDVVVPTDVGGPSDAGKPPAASGSATTATTPMQFALHHLWLGDSLANATFTVPTPPASPWATFGYNIDGLVTNENSTDVCTLNAAAHATAEIQVDGQNGIDNSFGKNIVPLLANAIPNLSQTVSSAIFGGSFTILVHTVGLTSSPTQTNTGLTGALFSGAPYAGTPPTSDAGAFLPTDDWPVFSASLAGGLDAGAKISFDDAYVTDGLWVNGTPTEVRLVLLLMNQPLVLDIHQAVITFQHTVDSNGQDHATNGTISGVLVSTEFLSEVNIVAAQQRYCAEASLLLNFIAQSADILHDGTNVKGKACDAISIGLAFDADAIAEPSQVTQSVDGGTPDGCVPDAG